MAVDRRGFVVLGVQGAAAFGALRFLSACQGSGSTVAQPGDFATLRDRYFLRTLSLNPVTATYLGGDAYDPSLGDVNGRLRDFSAAAIAAEVAFYQQTADALAALPASDPGTTEAVDRAVLAAQLRFLLHQYQERRYHERAVDTYVAEPFRGVDWQIQQMTDAGNGLLGTEAEWRLVVRRVSGIPAYLDTARANLTAGKAAGNQPDHRMVEEDGIKGAASNAAYFRSQLLDSARKYIGDRPFGPALLDTLGQAASKATDAWTAFGTFLQQAFGGDTADRYAVGEEEYNWRVRNCLDVQRSAAELWEYGAQQVAAYEDRLFRVAEQIAGQAGLGLPFATDADRRRSARAVIDHLSRNAPSSDQELLAWYIDAGKRAVAYGRQQQLFDVPDDYRLDVVFTPPVLQSTIDAAYYPAPPFKKSGVGRFYLSPTGNDPAALAANNRSSVATTAIHEGFPGHDWHYKYMTQHATEISNIRWLTPGAVEDSSSMWEDSMAAEGWALYA